MKHILIIKMGTSFAELKSQYGDFDDWIIQGMQVDRNRVDIIEVFKGDALPGHEQISGIVITGSHDMVTDRHDYHERAAKWLPDAIERKIPVLGICFGHQLLAYAMGGTVANNPNGLEFGTVSLTFHEEAKTDLLFKNLPPTIPVHVSHAQSVIDLPPKATVLASSIMDPHLAYVIGDNAWGVQFHPEFDAKITVAYINFLRQKLEHDGLNPDQLIMNCKDNQYGTMILTQFAQLIC